MNNYNNNNRSQEQINRIINNLTQKLNSKQQQEQTASKETDVNDLLKGLNEKQANQVKKILSDPQKAQKILESEQAQALIKKFKDKNE